MEKGRRYDQEYKDMIVDLFKSGTEKTDEDGFIEVPDGELPFD